MHWDQFALLFLDTPDLSFVLNLVQNHPWLANLLLAIGSFRLVLKPPGHRAGFHWFDQTAVVRAP